MLFVKVHRHSGNQSSHIVEQEVVAEGECAFENPKATGAVGEICEAILREIIEAVKPQVNKVGGIGVGIHRTEVRGHYGDFRAGLCDAVHFRHGAKNVRLVFDEVREIDFVRAGIAQRPGEARKLAENVGIRTRLAVKTNRPRNLFVLAAANIHDEHEDSFVSEFDVSEPAERPAPRGAAGEALRRQFRARRHPEHQVASTAVPSPPRSGGT